MSREIMQQALEYIKETYDFCVVMQQPKEREEQLLKAFEAALAQPEFDTPESHIVKWSIPVDPNNFGEPLAQPEQEHIECGYDETVGMCTNNPCCEQAQPEQDSISTNDHLCAMLRQVHDVLACTALPMKREWVGLTDEERDELLNGSTHIPSRLIDWVEQKLKEKNGAL